MQALFSDYVNFCQIYISGKSVFIKFPFQQLENKKITWHGVSGNFSFFFVQ